MAGGASPEHGGVGGPDSAASDAAPLLQAHRQVAPHHRQQQPTAEQEECCCGQRAQTQRQSASVVKLRLAVVIVGYFISYTIQSLLFPKLVLLHFGGDDGRSAGFVGWVTGFASLVQFLLLPSLCAAGDVLGRRGLLCGAAATQALACFAWGFCSDNVVAASVMAVVTCLCGMTVPICNAVVADLTALDDKAAAHGYGIVSAAFGVGVALGPLLGGWLVELHRPAACFAAAGGSAVGFLTATVFGWQETLSQPPSPLLSPCSDAPTPVQKPALRFVNPVAVVCMVTARDLRRPAAIFACWCTAIAAPTGVYTLLDYRFGWGAQQVGALTALLGACVAAVQLLGIRVLVPRLLSQASVVKAGMALQAASLVLWGVAWRGWQVFAGAPLNAMSWMVDPCLQALMVAAAPDTARVSALQGALYSMRLLMQGAAAPLCGWLFALGVSDATQRALHTHIPGLAFFAASAVSAVGCLLALPLARHPPAEAAKGADGAQSMLTEPLLQPAEGAAVVQALFRARAHGAAGGSADGTVVQQQGSGLAGCQETAQGLGAGAGDGSSARQAGIPRGAEQVEVGEG